MPVSSWNLMGRRLVLLLLTVYETGARGEPVCQDEATCQARVAAISERLDGLRTEMHSKQLTLQALEDLRFGILSGQRIDLPSAQRQYLEKGSPLISEISYDARHRPVSTNVSRHFNSLGVIGTDEVLLHTFMPLKKAASGPKAGPSALLVTIDVESRLSIFSIEGDTLLHGFDLGHGPERTVTQMALSPSQDTHFVLTADDVGEMRLHNLKVVARKEKKGEVSDGQKKQLIVTANFSHAFSIPPSSSGEQRKLTSLLPMDRGSQPYFVTGDSLGGVSVFYRNGTMKGRVRVTEDAGGVRGLIRSQAQMVLFFSSHSFGFFSIAQIDVQYPPCSGWNAPLYGVVADPSYASSRVVLALEDGDVLVFSTMRGKSKACDLSLKFPHVSALPFKPYAFRGHIIGLTTPLPDTDRKEDYLRELFFFNLAAMDAGYGAAPSRSVTLQASFKPKQPAELALLSSGGGGGGEKSKSKLAIRFVGVPGVELFELTLKQPAAPKAAAAEGEESSSWLNWFPKLGVFGVALIGVVIWNVRKATSQRRDERGDDFDEEYFKAALREKRKEREMEKSGGGVDLGAGAGGRSRVQEVGEGDDDD